MKEGFLLVDKPSGITSFEVIRRLWSAYPKTKMGHAGTLDPLASGLLVIGLGTSTKLLGKLLKLDKRYEARIVFGIETDTGDTDGRVVKEMQTGRLEEAAIRRVCASLPGSPELPVPLASAVKLHGVRLYRRMRAGATAGLTLPKRVMEVRSAELIRAGEEGGRAFADVSFHVGSGTYIRSLAVEMGRQLEVPATVGALRRTSIGPFSVGEAVGIDKGEIPPAHSPNEVLSRILPVSSL